MPQKLEQYLKEVEGLINNGLKTDSNTLQSLKDMQEEMTKEMMKEIKEMNKGKNRKKRKKISIEIKISIDNIYQMNKILDVVEDIKQNITDNQYKTIMDSSMEINK